ncbi:hypothetical protein B0H14DRAFT_2590771 [Mycena olivaceomarginata]|nr:hypothetical protein B0H14DRAFT_2590771 [Mycena olivaceomarginata]
MPAEEGGDEQGGGRVKCIPQGRGGGCRGAEGRHKGAVSQAGGYNVFHSAESRHMGAVNQGEGEMCCANQYAPALQQISPTQAPKSQKNPALAGMTCDNTGSIQPNRRILPQKKEWVVPCRDITTEGSSHGLGAYLHHNQDGDPFRVVISDIHNYPKHYKTVESHVDWCCGNVREDGGRAESVNVDEEAKRIWDHTLGNERRAWSASGSKWPNGTSNDTPEIQASVMNPGEQPQSGSKTHTPLSGAAYVSS